MFARTMLPRLYDDSSRYASSDWQVVAAAAEDTTGERLPILPLWGELIFGVIAFAILYWVVATKVVPNLEKAYAERTAAFDML